MEYKALPCFYVIFLILCDEVHSIQRIGESNSKDAPLLYVYEFKKACEMETDKEFLRSFIRGFIQKLARVIQKIGCNF